MIRFLRRGDYRIFVGAFPTGALAEQIQVVREQYDWKTAGITAPHVTLAGTYWRLGKGVPEEETAVIRTLTTCLANLPAFDLHLGGIRTFGNRIAYLEVKMTPELEDTRRTLVQCLGQDKHRRFTPHLTLSMRLKARKTAVMVNELRETAWHHGQFIAPITELHLMQRNQQDPAWRSIARFPLQ
ncbi:MAG: 2'-5' RNA ligase family protein [Chloroflexota bacterium]